MVDRATAWALEGPASALMAARRPRSERPKNDDPGAPWVWVGVVGLAAIGLALSAYLLQEHYVAWTDPDVKALCDINEALSCSVVARSPYAAFLGLPVAGWGVLGYVVIAAVGFWGWFGRRPAPAVAALGVLAAFCVVVSLALGIVSKLAIGVLCPFCMGTYGVNGALAMLSLALFAKTGWRAAFTDALALLRERLAPTAQLGAAGALAVGLLAWLYPKYWLVEDPITKALRSMPAPPPSASACPDTGIATGTTAEGLPWIGAQAPKVIITEFSDYQCPFCALAHHKLRALIEAHPRVIRAVHRHFPLDQACNPIIQEPFHGAACYYAGLAACAEEQGKFWAANDHLFLHGRDAKPIEIAGFAGELGLDRKALEECLEERAWTKIRPDLEAGIQLQIRGTPSFLVDGKLHMGSDPAEILAPYLEGGGELRATPQAPGAASNAVTRDLPPQAAVSVAASAAVAPRATAAPTATASSPTPSPAPTSDAAP